MSEIIKKKRGRKPKNKQYFGENEEKAVIEYIKTDSHELKHNIYNNILKIPFKKMTSSILRKYNNYIGNYDIMEVELDGLSHLIENMIKFRPYIIEYQLIDTDDVLKWYKHRKFRYLNIEDANTKLKQLESVSDGYKYRMFNATAYAYCGTIVRNYYKDHSKNSRNEQITKQYMESGDFNFDEDINYSYELDIEDDEDQILKIFNKVIQSISYIIKNNNELLENEKTVGMAIINVFSNWEYLFMEQTEIGEYDKKITNNFTKNKILHYLQEITNMDIKEIRSSMKVYKELYNLIKENKNE
jgi:cell division protein ZapA (FtsZ GTPase activity inhibitor)